MTGVHMRRIGEIKKQDEQIPTRFGKSIRRFPFEALPGRRQGIPRPPAPETLHKTKPQNQTQEPPPRPPHHLLNKPFFSSQQIKKLTWIKPRDFQGEEINRLIILIKTSWKQRNHFVMYFFFLYRY